MSDDQLDYLSDKINSFVFAIWETENFLDPPGRAGRSDGSPFAR